MKNNLASAVLSILLLSSPTFAKSRNWQAVTDLPPGIEIAVRAEDLPYIPCAFEHANQKELVCEHVVYGPRGAASREFVYERKKIREVRLERGENTNGAVTGALIGGAAGSALGASVGNSAPGRVVGGLFLGGLGAVFGGSIGRSFHSVHGKVIYRR
ncbi:MAG TPA: hypothetical protein VMI10_20830 [Terriglobales bacterium]|nr:hypothetical protein [Terriglobales bacterium]